MEVNINVRFSDSSIFELKCNTDMPISNLVSKAILLRNKISDIKEDNVPQYLIEKFKLVHNGKLYKNYDDKISSLTDINNNTTLNCIFPILNKDEITKLYESLEVSHQEIESLLNRKEFRDQLKNPKFYNKILELITNDVKTDVIDDKEIFKNQLLELHNIGFIDDNKSIELLKKHNNNMQEVVNELLG